MGDRAAAMAPAPSAADAAVAALDRPALRHMLADLLAVPSITGTDAESRAQQLMAQWYADAGLDVDLWRIDLAEVTGRPDFPGLEAPRDQAWGVTGTWTGSGGGQPDGPALILNGHVDVVPRGDLAQWTTDPFTPRFDAGTDGRESVYGRGAVDMKAGLVAALAAVRAVRSAAVPLRRSVQLQSVAGEEDGGLGTFATLLRGHTGDLAVIPEPTSGVVVCACAGALTFRLTIRGRATHASLRKQGVSAVEKLWPIWPALAALEERRNRDPHALMRHLDPPYPLSVGTVRAGDWPSSVPDLLVAEGRLGVALDEDVAAARRELSEAVARACAADPWLSDHPAEVEFFGGQFQPGQVGPDSPLVRLVSAAHERVAGAPAAVLGAPYGSDLRLFTRAGVPAVCYGAGAANQAHAPDEHVALAEVEQTAEALVRLIVAVCGPPTTG
ncbi:MAG: ArgE/DapE family deacylase [Actinomycetota bacterium]|nr:ArgE/DapE family deacylase [Actinomycetota bacterium]